MDESSLQFGNMNTGRLQDNRRIGEQASRIKGRSVQEARGMDRDGRDQESNWTLLTDYLEMSDVRETPSESLKHLYMC